MLDKAGFETWLEKVGDKPIHHLVKHEKSNGYRACECPIAVYLAEKYNLPHSAVFVRRTSATVDGVSMDLPEWAYWFTVEIDRLPATVTGTECLKVLRGIK